MPQNMQHNPGYGTNPQSVQPFNKKRPPPWEVPLGELVGKESFALLPKIYTGYGEKGPSQGLLHREGMTEESRQRWPLLDYILNCTILDELELP